MIGSNNKLKDDKDVSRRIQGLSNPNSLAGRNARMNDAATRVYQGAANFANNYAGGAAVKNVIDGLSSDASRTRRYVNPPQVGQSQGPTSLDNVRPPQDSPITSGQAVQYNPLDTGAQQTPTFAPFVSSTKAEPIPSAPATSVAPIAQAPEQSRAMQALSAQPIRTGPQRQMASAEGSVITGRKEQTGIAAPKTMGDMLRYNRESKMQRQMASIANENATTGIAAFNAQRQAEHLNNSDANASLQTNITKDHYTRSDNAEDTRNALLDRAEQNTNARSIAEAESNAALKSAQVRNFDEQALTSKTARDNSYGQVRLDQDIISAKQALANDPTNENIKLKLQALEGKTETGLSEYEKAKLSQGELKMIADIQATLPMSVKPEDAPMIAYQMYMDQKNALQNGGQVTPSQNSTQVKQAPKSAAAAWLLNQK